MDFLLVMYFLMWKRLFSAGRKTEKGLSEPVAPSTNREPGSNNPSKDKLLQWMKSVKVLRPAEKSRSSKKKKGSSTRASAATFTSVTNSPENPQKALTINGTGKYQKTISQFLIKTEKDW